MTSTLIADTECDTGERIAAFFIGEYATRAVALRLGWRKGDLEISRALIRVNFCKQAVKEREMAFFDDPQQLIAHLRHSFVTSDDTGRVRLETDSVGSVSQIIMCGLLLFLFRQGMATPISTVFMLSTKIVTS